MLRNKLVSVDLILIGALGLDLSYLDEVAVKLVGQLEELLYPEEADGDEHEPVVKTGEAVKGNDLESEDDGRRPDTSADDDRGDEPAESHLGSARDHNECVVGEDREEHDCIDMLMDCEKQLSL